MATQKQLKDHFLSLKDALYVWGANCQTITKSLMDSLYKTFGNGTYNKAYYDGKLKAGEGKKGADCSGAIFPISGYDATAANYYKRCTKKGDIASVPKNKVCLVFKRNSKGSINHVGCYTGDGYVCEMASSQKNYQRKPLTGNGWDLWGCPDFITDFDVEQAAPVAKPTQSTSKKSDNVRDFQNAAILDGFTFPKYGVDSEWGEECEGVASKAVVKCRYEEVTQNGKKVKKAVYKYRNLTKIVQRKVGVTVDGKCGTKTDEAIKVFQSKHGLTADGCCGLKTWRKILEV